MNRRLTPTVRPQFVRARQHPFGFDEGPGQLPQSPAAGDGGAIGLSSFGDDNDPHRLSMPVHLLERRLGLDPLIDAITPLQADQPVSGEAALAAMPAHAPRRQQTAWH